jgi:transposase
VKLWHSLAAWLGGNQQACSMVVPPSVEQEDRRRLSRERGELVAVRIRPCNRIGGLLANQGIVGFQPLRKGALQALGALRTGDGRELAEHLRTPLERMLQRLALLVEQIKAAEAVGREQRGLGRRETFNFLGFTMICGKSRRGKFLLWRLVRFAAQPRRDRLQAKLLAVKEELRRRMHQPIPRQGEWLRG